jgi:hypothetical protein
MTIFPLDPLEHLHGDLSTLVEYQYPCQVLAALGLTYARLHGKYCMDATWMGLMNLTLREWTSLGMTVRDVNAMAEVIPLHFCCPAISRKKTTEPDDLPIQADAIHVFGATRSAVAMRIGANESFGPPPPLED